MERLVEYVAACLAPAAALLAAEKAWTAWSGPRDSRTPEPPIPTAGRDISLLSRDLARLQGELRTLRRAAVPARVHRLRATTLAYDDVLESCCTALQVADGLPEREWSCVDRLEVEAALEGAGLHW